jgi:outer membrane protein OmpA-like peptidoglycan-associated protein
MIAAVALPAWGSASAQQQASSTTANRITVVGEVPADAGSIVAPAEIAELPAGPEIAGVITARQGETLQITTADGTNAAVLVSAATDIRSSGGFLGMTRTKLGSEALLNGLPVTVKTAQWDGRLVARDVRFKTTNLATAAMIRTGTAQRFGEHDTKIAANTAAAEALRNRVADIDQYNIRGTTNVYFDTGKANLSPSAQGELCSAASQAGTMDNALLLVVGYTDAVGDEEFNQELSEKRAGRVVNYLQQKCGWAPYRMLTPTGMAEADPAADNETAEGKAQNRRVAVNILVSKAVEGI